MMKKEKQKEKKDSVRKMEGDRVGEHVDELMSEVKE